MLGDAVGLRFEGRPATRTWEAGRERLPGPDERKAIWENNLPASAPVDGVDTGWLADRFELSGGQIRNAAVRAAFVAAAEGTAVTMSCAVRGVAAELRKQGRLLKPAEFGDYAELIT